MTTPDPDEQVVTEVEALIASWAVNVWGFSQDEAVPEACDLVSFLEGAGWRIIPAPDDATLAEVEQLAESLRRNAHRLNDDEPIDPDNVMVFMARAAYLLAAAYLEETSDD